MKTDAGEFLDKPPADLFSRVADFVATAETTRKEQQAWSRRFLNLMVARDFLPNSPTLTGAGRDMCLSAAGRRCRTSTWVAASAVNMSE